MKIAVLSDIHGNLPALQAVLEEVERERADAVVNLGDILSGPLLPAETADFLMARGFVTIAGNHERQLLRLKDRGRSPDAGTSDGYAAGRLAPAHWDWVRSLPATRWLAPDVLLVHGTPASDLVYWLETVTEAGGLRAATAAEVADRATGGPDLAQASLVLCGHSHVPRIVRQGPALIVNPGSVGLQAYEGDEPAPHRMENGAPEARYAIVERRAAGWSARLCSVPYDWQPVQRLARENGRPEWAHALATGRMPPAQGQ